MSEDYLIAEYLVELRKLSPGDLALALDELEVFSQPVASSHARQEAAGHALAQPELEDEVNQPLAAQHHLQEE
jgi:hypothetical protein